MKKIIIAALLTVASINAYADFKQDLQKIEGYMAGLSRAAYTCSVLKSSGLDGNPHCEMMTAYEAKIGFLAKSQEDFPGFMNYVKNNKSKMFIKYNKRYHEAKATLEIYGD